VKAIQGHGKHVLCIVDTYNKLIDELQAMPRPFWMLPEHMPMPLDCRTAINIDPDGPLWEDMALENILVTLWGVGLDKAAPYIHDPRVRRGIKFILQLDRVTEEETRLAVEQQNLRAEFIHTLFFINNAWLSSAGIFLSSCITSLLTH
jgi:hypothetical protein